MSRRDGQTCTGALSGEDSEERTGYLRRHPNICCLLAKKRHRFRSYAVGSPTANEQPPVHCSSLT